MDKIAFVFSGQGDQFPGMGKDLYEKYPAAAEVFNMCDGIRPGTSAQCFEATEEELKQTRNTQPCLYAMELAAAAALRSEGIVPAAAAGFSLGEVAAAAAAGLFDRETGFRLVCRRAELMQRESEKFDTSMAAVVRLSPEKVEELCGRYTQIYPVNYNCPGQVTVSGLSEQMPDFFADVKAAGGRALPLKVKGAFHSPFMAKAGEDFAKELAAVSFGVPAIPLYSNMTAQVYSDDPARLLSEQISSPVRWEKLIGNMIAAGVDTFVEIGPGKTLTNMIRKIDDRVGAFCVAELPALLAEVRSC